MTAISYDLIHGAVNLSGSLQAQLLESDSPVMLHFPKMLNDSYCDAVASQFSALTLTPYEATMGSTEFAPIPKIGPALFEYHDEMVADPAAGLMRYFDQADLDMALLRGLFMHSDVPDPLDVLHNIAGILLGQAVDVACEGRRAYFSGVVRNIDGGALPHYDDASVDTPALTVGKTDRQLSLLMYLTSFSGGGLTSYGKKPTQIDNSRHQFAYGYKWDAVNGIVSQTMTPNKGSVIIFNPRFLHSVGPISGTQRRLTVSAFIGRSTESGQLISWS